MVLAFEANGETLSYQPRSRMVRFIYYAGCADGERWVPVRADGKSWARREPTCCKSGEAWEVRKKHSESDAAIRELIKGVVEEIKAERTALTLGESSIRLAS